MFTWEPLTVVTTSNPQILIPTIDWVSTTQTSFIYTSMAPAPAATYPTTHFLEHQADQKHATERHAFVQLPLWAADYPLRQWLLQLCWFAGRAHNIAISGPHIERTAVSARIGKTTRESLQRSARKIIVVFKSPKELL